MTVTLVRRSPTIAIHVEVHGVVQGVGFRPFVYRLAATEGLSGWVRNESGAVGIALEGPEDAVHSFLRRLEAEAPPLARIDAVATREATLTGAPDFRIVDSHTVLGRRLPVAPDVALCAECERELFDPANRRYRYPFITCTACGPRFTVIEGMPYDRARTTMRAFTQCPTCAREYATPADRRYHSETNSCPVCGPRVWLVGAGEREAVTQQPIPTAARLLAAGLVVAVRGLGGFHLAVDATNDGAVARLRRRKRRQAKPFAVMVRTLADAERLASVTPAEARLLTSPERPIVLTPPRNGHPLAPSVAPGLGVVGLMLAYTPLHHLLLDEVARPLVMTSGNLSDEPIAITNDDALQRLTDVADAFLLHDREIAARYDDSVIRVADEASIVLRRARGHAPLPVRLPVPAPVPLVAVGPHLKNTFTLADGSDAYVSQHIGDLESLETYEHFMTALETYRRLFHVEPEVVVRDGHPGYLSTRIAGDLGLARCLAVQHHHAHIAACAAEHGETGPVIGVAFDGTGYGDDAKVWGAEVLVADLCDYRRVAHLRYAPLPGGDLAAREPWRAALGYLSLEPGLEEAFAAALAPIDPGKRLLARQQIARHLNTPLASSMGRLFDAAAAVLGVRLTAQFEGQAAMELEALAGDRPADPLPFPVTISADGMLLLEPVPLLAALGERRARGESVALLAARFHESVAAGAVTLVRRLAAMTALRTVALGGGVFQNSRLAVSLRRRLEQIGLRVLTPRILSPNDGAISYGQAAVAAARLAREGGP